MDGERIYRFVPTDSQADYDTVRAVLASVGIRMISWDSDGTRRIVVNNAMIMASALIMQGLFDNMFVLSVEYRDRPTNRYYPLTRRERY